jgi:tRNA pseudouridine55 synthase
VLLLGRSTRLSRYVMDLKKSYTATARLGAVSDTLDAEGEITHLDTPIPPENALRTVLPAFTGDILQIPPMVSALKQEGKRLYDLHRQGITVERKPRPVTIPRFALTTFDSAEMIATFEITCSSGTYVRTLIADLANRAGSGAYLTALRRTTVGHLTIQEAQAPDDLTPESLHNHIILPAEVVGHLPGTAVSGDGRDVVCHGGRLEGRGIEGSYRVMWGDELLAVYRDEGEEARAEVVLCAG